MSESEGRPPRIALITGGTSGIGRTVARELLAAGDKVAVVYGHDDQAAAALREEASGLGWTILVLKADVTRANDVQQAIRSTETELGPVSLLVNNVGGVLRRAPFTEVDEALWDAVIDLNLKSAYLLMHALLPGMVERGAGAIVNVSAFAARNGGAGNGSIPYGAAKAALEALTVGLARDYAGSGVRVNAVQLGLVDTPLHLRTEYDPRYGRAEDFMAKVSTATPMHRAATSQEVAAAVRFLLSDDASYITGAILGVTGGL